MILIVSYFDDPHAALVKKAINESGFDECALLDIERALNEHSYVISPHQWEISCGGNGASLDWKNCHAVWWRRSGKFPVPSFRPELSGVSYAESYWTIRWLVEALPGDLFPFGHPHQLRCAENKIRQLQLAKHVGFSLPETCISNSRERLICFAKPREFVIVKPLYVGSAVMESQRETPLQTSVVSSATLIQELSAASEIECLFLQSRVPKQMDVRTLAMPGGKCWSFAIDTSHYDATTVDWRIDSMTLDHRLISTPDRIVTQIQTYLQSINLTSGSFDFGITETGEWNFFECNPNGQWLWLELKTGVELAREFAAVLVDHHERNRARN